MEYELELNKPIRFLAMRWHEDWEFDHPTVLLEPICRYSPFGESLEGMIENAALDIAFDYDDGNKTRKDFHESELKEFKWRGWTEANLRRVAKMRKCGIEFPRKQYEVLEQWVVFHTDKYEVTIFDVYEEFLSDKS